MSGYGGNAVPCLGLYQAYGLPHLGARREPASSAGSHSVPFSFESLDMTGFGSAPGPLSPLAVLGRPINPPGLVSVQQPILMATFSYDENKSLCFDDRAKRWYKIPPTQENSAQGADLNVGFERFHDKPHIPDPLDSVFYTIMQRSAMRVPLEEPVKGKIQVPAENLESEMLRTQLVTWRGILTKLCTAWSCHVQAPSMYREGFELNAMMLGDTLVLEEVPPTMMQWQAIQHERPKPKRSQRATYYGMCVHVCVCMHEFCAYIQATTSSHTARRRRRG